MLFDLGLLGALAFVLWQMFESLFVLRSLCPWCLLVWAVVIAMFIVATVFDVRTGTFGARLSRSGTGPQ